MAVCRFVAELGKTSPIKRTHPMRIATSQPPLQPRVTILLLASELQLIARAHTAVTRRNRPVLLLDTFPSSCSVMVRGSRECRARKLGVYSRVPSRSKVMPSGPCSRRTVVPLTCVILEDGSTQSEAAVGLYELRGNRVVDGHPARRRSGAHDGCGWAEM